MRRNQVKKWLSGKVQPRQQERPTQSPRGWKPQAAHSSTRPKTYQWWKFHSWPCSTMLLVTLLAPGWGYTPGQLTLICPEKSENELICKISCSSHNYPGSRRGWSGLSHQFSPRLLLVPSLWGEWGTSGWSDFGMNYTWGPSCSESELEKKGLGLFVYEIIQWSFI